MGKCKKCKTDKKHHKDKSEKYHDKCDKSETESHSDLSVCEDNHDKNDYKCCKELICATMPYVEYKRFAGKWYQMARLPIKHQDACINSTSEYKWLEREQVLEVINTCYFDNNVKIERKGIVNAPYNDHPGVLHVKFTDDSSECDSYYLLHYTDYDNIAVIGTPDRKYFWILARNRSINASSCRRINEMVKLGCRLGYDTCKLIFSY